MLSIFSCAYGPFFGAMSSLEKFAFRFFSPRRFLIEVLIFFLLSYKSLYILGPSPLSDRCGIWKCFLLFCGLPFSLS